MRIGVTVPNVHETLAERTTIEAVARTAEDLGFDSIWCNDHVVMPSAPDGAEAEPAYAAAYGQQRGQNIYDPLITLAYLAAATDRVLLGTSVYLLPLRHPIVAAKQVVSLDGLSGGRFVFGVGVGWLEGEFEAVGVPYRQRGRRTDEAIAVFKALCAGDSVAFLPEPVQRPHPPLWIGGRSDAAMRRAARSGDAWHPSHLTTDELRQRIPQLHAECERAGRAPDDVAVATRRKVLRSSSAPEGERDRVLHGDPSAIAETVAELEQVGVSHLIVELPGSSEAELLESLDWFGREVLVVITRG
ncbi:MAG TPA: LLM class F420-dependent oxidoreductase [Solirubrobacteraceae bacterium]|nr:LLM class F420-dependent oxidoreductase [Solirubrobacteraceae bacterium]